MTLPKPYLEFKERYPEVLKHFEEDRHPLR